MARKPNGSAAAPDEDEILIEPDADATTQEEKVELGGDGIPGVEELKAQLAKAEEDRKKLESDLLKERNSHRQEAAKTGAELADAQKQMIENAISASTAEKEAAKRALLDAKETGNYAAEVDAQDRLTQINLKLARLNEGKLAIENRADAEKNLPSDPVERFASQLSPKSAEWVRAHPEAINNVDELIRADMGAKFNRLTPDTPAYFEFVEKELGYRPKDAPATREVEDEGEVVEVQRQRMPPAAPPSRGAGGGGDGPTRYRLTRAEVEMASAMGMTNEEYLKQKLALEKEGLLTPRTTH